MTSGYGALHARPRRGRAEQVPHRTVRVELEDGDFPRYGRPPNLSFTYGEFAMTEKSNKPETAKNYSTEQEQFLRDNAPITFEQTKALGSEWNKSAASVRAKVISMGLEYIPKAKPSKKVSKGDTKAELLAKIERQLDAEDMLKGLEKATAQALVNLLGCARVAMREAREHGPDYDSN